MTLMADVLNPDALHHELDRLEGWSGTTDGLEKRYRFADFNGSIAFVNRVAAVAEELDHHPDITVNWNTVTLRLVTHSAGGVTQNDVELARRLDPLATDNPREAREIAPDAPDARG
jgi:4a-hydroxytetrahydrobiopterin dehydratase